MLRLVERAVRLALRRRGDVVDGEVGAVEFLLGIEPQADRRLHLAD